MSIYPYYLIKKSQASQSQEREGGRVRGGEKEKGGGRERQIKGKEGGREGEKV